MLFNSPVFIFIFLPITLVGWHFTSRKLGGPCGLAWLLAASSVFYSYWYPPYALLLGSSIALNFTLALQIERSQPRLKWLLMIITSALNLGTIALFKYADFGLDIMRSLGWPVQMHFGWELPLGISFFTFQQLSYVIDVFRGHQAEKSWRDYALFTVFYPQLIAGPVLPHQDLLPQFHRSGSNGLKANDMALGIAIFIVGLSKKCLVADTFSVWVSPVFNRHPGTEVGFIDAWISTLSYTFQLYFDFSGYSDMAVGLGRMLGFSILVNFDSPYKATSMVDFWRRWHITLSKVLRDYLYIPLGGSRCAPWRRYFNLILTMTVCGLWHGAGWPFIIWGFFHGVVLSINHVLSGWLDKSRRLLSLCQNRLMMHFVFWPFTFLIVITGWVLFRSGSVAQAMDLLKTLAGVRGVSLPPSYLALLNSMGLGFGSVISVRNDWLVFAGPLQVVLLMAALLWVKLGRNTQQWFGYDLTGEFPGQTASRWKPGVWFTILLGLAFTACILRMTEVSEFLYFQF